jgi:hypothetical protein
LAEGKAPDWICQRLNDVLDGATVYTDDPDYDGQWLGELFAVTWGITPSFKLASTEAVLIEMLAQQACASPADAVRRLSAIKAEVRKQFPRRHRARWDVEYLVELCRCAGA